MTSEQIQRFFRSYLLQLSESLFIRSAIDSRRCDEIRSLARRSESKRIAVALLREGFVRVPELNLTLQLKWLRETNGRKFPHIEILVSQRPRRKRRVCFVGHRFTPAIAKSLRWNLRQVLEPYNIRLDWSGQDPQSVQILEDIVRRIRAADFCVFDTRATQGKPNVYIEAGIAYAVKTPFILFDFVPSTAKTRGTGASIPSDLAHALSLRYTTYEALFKQFYFSLPAFAEANFE